MQLSIFNGSPRGKSSNTKILLEKFTNGIESVNEKINYTISYLNQTKKIDDSIKEYLETEYIILAFPLYTDSMPGIVKFFIEKLAEIKAPHKKNIGFIVQSGFPEGIHSSFVEKYLKKLTKRLGCEYLGTIIKGGVEGIQIMPEMMTKKLFAAFYDLGAKFGENKEFDQTLIEQLKKPYKLTKRKIFTYSILSKIGILNFYWNKKLKENNAFDQRFDAPYA